MNAINQIANAEIVSFIFIFMHNILYNLFQANINKLINSGDIPGAVGALMNGNVANLVSFFKLKKA